ncbi:hypothetical protein PAMP_022688 [Pampus punctatissimus]
MSFDDLARNVSQRGLFSPFNCKLLMPIIDSKGRYRCKLLHAVIANKANDSNLLTEKQQNIIPTSAALVCPPLLDRRKQQGSLAGAQ